jgi:tRNA nucleotidyltransferase (CCA-adding enzyme)
MTGSSEIDPDRLGESVQSLPGAERLREIAELAPAYLVGGVVRDLLLGREIVDVDVVIEGPVDGLAHLLPGFGLEREALFLTGHLDQGEVRIDVAQARAETYPAPGALPEVTPASIAEDLARRDFTVNAMAVPLSGEAQLLDPHHGLADLRDGLLRVLHESSFTDDPTRALRAARYAARFGFELEPETDSLLRRTDLTTVSEDRVENELRRIAAEHDPAAALRLIVEWGVLPSLDPRAPDRVAEVTRLAASAPWSDWVDRELAVMLAIVRPLPQIRELAAATPERPSEAVRLASAWDPAQLLVARALGAEWLDDYAAELRHVRLEVSGDDLIAEGVPEGPAIGRGLEAALSGRLDGEIAGREQELTVALAAARGELPED